jgi:hypothetical protein
MDLFSQFQIDDADPSRYVIRSNPLVFVIGSSLILTVIGAILLSLRRDGVILIVALVLLGLVLLNLATSKAYHFQADTRAGMIELSSRLAIHKSLRASHWRIPLADVVSIDARASAGGRKPSGPYSLELCDKNGKRTQITAEVFGEQEVKPIVAYLRQRLGLLR